MKKIQEKPMSPRAKQLYLRKLDRECPDFGFYDAYQWYQRRKNINHHRSMDKNRKEKLLCEIFKIENPDAIEGYENVLGYH
ncbi:MAG: hypothetical protein PHU69_13820 [Fermentimonas sp.]|nr:hypothetical protein [Fermentimonas sp.]